jgi:hypothetical protein
LLKSINIPEVPRNCALVVHFFVPTPNELEPPLPSVVMTGKVRLTRGSPLTGSLVWLIEEDGDSFRIVGDLRSEVMKLQGAQLKVRGKYGETENVIEVESYVVVDDSGIRPFVGKVIVKNDVWSVDNEGETTLESGDFYLIDDIEELKIETTNSATLRRLEQWVGAKVKMSGQIQMVSPSEVVLRPLRYGLLRGSNE